MSTIGDIPILVGPDQFLGHLGAYKGLEASDADSSTDEVGLDEDEDAALPSDERERWLEFLGWLGVNEHLRLVHFHDVEDDATGWLSTEGLARPRGWVFGTVTASDWAAWSAGFERELIAREPERSFGFARWFYETHHLEHLDPLISAAAADSSGGVGGALYRHIDRHWPVLSRSATAVAALTEGSPRRRTEPKRAAPVEQVRCGDDFWLWRLKEAAFCPTAHGPRRPRETWQRSREMDRRFGSNAGLLPVLEFSGRPAMAESLGIRGELTASNFSIADARVLLATLSVVYRDAGDNRRMLRELRGACRQLVELLAGHAPPKPVHDVVIPALVADELVWLPPEQVFFAERRRTEHFSVPIFVLEAEPRAKAPLAACFGVRGLDDCLVRSPRPGEPSVSDVDLEVFRDALWARGPALLARLAAERQEEGRATEDARLLRAFLRGVLPVTQIQVVTTLDGATLGDHNGEPVGCFVDRSNAACAFVEWGERGWPPVPEDEERIADALCQLYGPNWYEPFLTLVHCPDEAARLRVLRRAGAPTDLIEFARRLDHDVERDSPLEAQSTPTLRTPGALITLAVPPPGPQMPDDHAAVPLWRAEDLLVSGSTLTVRGDKSHYDQDNDPNRVRILERQGSGRGGRHGNTDLEALDALGMAIALAFEVARLAAVGGGQVFDVSTPARIAAAGIALQTVFERELLPAGVAPDWPGCDLLSVDGHGRVARLIELKSSGVAARVQECTWNEWKTAGRSGLRERFYLYLVGNLRSDLADQRPFVRTVQDPFGQLRAAIQLTTRVERRVQLQVAAFDKAEEEILQVLRQPVRVGTTSRGDGL